MKNSVPAAADAPGPAVLQSERPFLTTSQLQKNHLPLSRRSIYDWRMKGIIPSVQVGGKILFHWPSVEAALLRRQNGGVA